MKKVALLYACLSLFTVSAQTATPAATPTPATKLESFISQTGILTIRETVAESTIPVQYGATLSIEAVRVYSPGQEATATKGTVFTLNSGQKYASDKTDFVDLDELDGLIKALDYISAQTSKIDKALTPEFRYRTKSGLRVGEFVDTNGGVTGFVDSGSTSVFLTPASVTALHDSLVKLLGNLNVAGK